jgi:flagellar biosynthesis protein FlhB
MVKNGDQIEKMFSHNSLKSDLYAISILEKFKMLISKGFFMNIILEIIVVMVVMVVMVVANI